MMHKTLLLTSLALLAAVGCKKTDDTPPTTSYQAGTPGAAGAAATALPTATVPPAVAPAPTTPAAAPAAAADPTVVAAITPMLTQVASTQTVAGSKALGAAMVGNVAPGAPLESQIMLQPNKCYSVVAVGMPPIAELNVQFVGVVIPTIMAVDQDTGATAVLGKKPNCYKWALPLPVAVKVSVQSAGGAGVAAAQVFEK